MNIIDAASLATIQTGEKITQGRIGEILGYKTKQSIYRHKDKELSPEQISLIEKTLNVSISQQRESLEIKYLKVPGIKEHILKNNLVTSLWFDRELVENVWKKDPANLRIVKMLGDKMDAGDYPLKHNDTLIIDISETDVINSGIYAFTTEVDGEKYIFICGIYVQPDGDLRFYFTNKNVYPDKIRSRQTMADINFRVVGRIIKNLSLLV